LRTTHFAQDDKTLWVNLGDDFWVGVVVGFLDLELHAEVADELGLAAGGALETSACHEEEDHSTMEFVASAEVEGVIPDGVAHFSKIVDFGEQF
jgi:hypothetical protein